MATYTSVTPTEKLRSDAADSLQRCVSHGGMPLEVNDGYRSYAEQAVLFVQNYTRDYPTSAKRDKRYWNGKAYWRRLGNTVAVAVPGTSNHGDGSAVDLGVNARAWMFKHGLAYGWVNPAWAKNPGTYEPWHWEYHPAIDKMKELWRDMPDLKKLSRKKDQKLKKNTWNTILLNDKGYTSAVIGSKAFDVDVWVDLKAPNGTQMRVRFYKVNYKTGKRVYTYDDSKVDSSEVKGSTGVFQFSVKGGCSADERVRAEIYTWVDGVTLTEAASRAHIW